MMQAIRAYFGQYATLSDADWAAFAARLVQQDLPKRRQLLKAGQTENRLSFVESGILRYFIPGPKETTFAFVFEGEFSCAYDSFLTRRPATYAVETLTPASLWHISHADLQDIYATTSAGERIGRHAAEGLFLKKAARELSLLTEPAGQRYHSLLQERPQLLQHIPLKYLASYIGITPQALSRIRARSY